MYPEGVRKQKLSNIEKGEIMNTTREIPHGIDLLIELVLGWIFITLSFRKE
jgi:hypothetical protein